MKRTSTLAIAFGVFALAGAFILYRVFVKDSSLANIQERGVIRVAYAVEAPYAFLLPGGEVTGESPETAKYVASALGIGRIEWRQVEFRALIPELTDGRVDAIAAGMFITPERARLVSFSEPTFHVRQGLLTVKGNPHGLHSYQDALSDPNVKIAVLSGSVEELLLRHIGLDDSRLVVAPDALTGRVAVEAGRADGLALSSPTIRWMALQGEMGLVEAVQPFEQTDLPEAKRLGYGAFAFRKSDNQLRIAWNKVLATFVGSPAHMDILMRFGFTQDELPGATSGAMSAEELSRP
jgi:polar amino acid transport system substrate-binding protein